MNRNHSPKKTGFTLIEILLVMGILCILIALAFPVFSRVREKGRHATCTSNLRQLALATQQYVQDNDGIYPIVIDIQPEIPPVWWHQRLQSYLKYGPVYSCPTLASLDPERAKPTNYSINRFDLNHRPTLMSGGESGKHEAQLQFAAKTFLMTETLFLAANGSGGFDPPAAQPGIGIISPCGPGMTYVSVVHSGGGNYSFLDGHVKWFAPPAAAQVECDSNTLLR